MAEWTVGIAIFALVGWAYAWYNYHLAVQWERVANSWIAIHKVDKQIILMLDEEAKKCL